MSEYALNEDVRPGVHPFAEQRINEVYTTVEKRIIDIFKRYWYVTKADILKIGASDYKYVLIKAPENLANLFNISAEIIVIFSSYEKFEPRTFDAFDNVKERLETGRVEN